MRGLIKRQHPLCIAYMVFIIVVGIFFTALGFYLVPELGERSAHLFIAGIAVSTCLSLCLVFGMSWAWCRSKKAAARRKIERLLELCNDGIITKAELEAKRAEILRDI